MYDDNEEVEVEEEVQSSTWDEEADSEGKAHRSVILLPVAGGKDAEYEERRARLLESFNTHAGMKADLRYYTNEADIPALLEKYRKMWVQVAVVYPRFF